MSGVAHLIRERAKEITRWATLEVGKPLGESQGGVNAAAAQYEWFAEEGKRVYGRMIPASKPGVHRWVMKQPVDACDAKSETRTSPALRLRQSRDPCKELFGHGRN